MVRKEKLRVIANGAMTGGAPPQVSATVRASGWGANPLHALWRLSAGRLAMYLDQLGDLLNAGITMHEAMNQLSVYAHDRRLKRMSQEIAAGSSRGESFYAQLQRYPQLLPPQVTGMLLVGERAGTLPAVCHELATELRQQQATRWKYAIGQLFFGAIFFTALLVPGLPRLIRMDESLANLPWWQRPDWAAYGHYVNTVVWPVLLGFAVVWNGAKLIGAIPALAGPVQRLLYLTPGARQLIRRAAMIRVMVSLDALLRAGVPIQEALGLAAQSAGNVVISRGLELAAQRIRDGATLEQALSGSKAVPQEIAQSLILAERAGTYERTLGALVKGWRDAKSRAVLLFGYGAYGIMMLLSAAIVIWALSVGYTGYFNSLFQIFDDK